MDESTIDRISRVIQQRYEEGYRKGLEEAAAKLADHFEAKFPREPRPKRTRRAETRPRLKNPAETLAGSVSNSLAILAAGNPEGVEPTAITLNLAENGVDADLRQTRLVLRHLTLTGNALRVARGRYLPATAPTPLAAE